MFIVHFGTWLLVLTRNQFENDFYWFGRSSLWNDREGNFLLATSISTTAKVGYTQVKRIKSISVFFLAHKSEFEFEFEKNKKIYSIPDWDRLHKSINRFWIDHRGLGFFIFIDQLRCDLSGSSSSMVQIYYTFRGVTEEK